MAIQEKSGGVFIAYQGNDYNKEDIVRRLQKYCPSSYNVRAISKEEHGIVFAKVVYYNYICYDCNSCYYFCIPFNPLVVDLWRYMVVA